MSALLRMQVGRNNDQAEEFWGSVYISFTAKAQQEMHTLNILVHCLASDVYRYGDIVRKAKKGYRIHSTSSRSRSATSKARLSPKLSCVGCRASTFLAALYCFQYLVGMEEETAQNRCESVGHVMNSKHCDVTFWFWNYISDSHMSFVFALV